MEYGLTNLTQPASEPVALALAKAHLRIDHTAEDTLITGWITAARQLTESYTGRRWIEQSMRLTLERFPYSVNYVPSPLEPVSRANRTLRLPVQPITSIDRLAYIDAFGEEQLLSDGTDYQKWLDHNPPLVAPTPSGFWPITQYGALQAVTIDFTAGGAAADVPGQVSAAILLALGNWDENRGDQNVIIARGLPPAARFLLDQLWTGVYS